MESQSAPLEMLFIPCLSPNQGISIVDLARICAARGQHVTIVATESIVSVIQKPIEKDANSGHHISILPVQLPRKQANLPDGIDNFSQVKDEPTTRKMFVALYLLRPQIEEIISSRLPDCIVADSFFWWATETAARFNIPRLTFYPFNAFSLCLKYAVMGDVLAHHLKFQTDLYEPFQINDLPNPITMTLSQLPDFLRKGDATFTEQMEKADKNSFAVLLNSFQELDPAYNEHYTKSMGHGVISIGPTNMALGAETRVSAPEHESLNWLNSKEPNSVLYVCFSSWSIFSNEQLIEIAFALENSGCQFFWNFFGSNDDCDSLEDKELMLPGGIKEKIEDRGIIYKRSDAPHSLILEHKSICGFMTHSEWKAIIGGLSAGVPMIFWSWAYEHFLTEKLATQVLGIGVEVGAMDCNYWFDVEKIVIKRETIEKAVRKLMNGGDEVEEMRRKVKELMKKAKNAVAEGGSSHKSLTNLIENLKKLRDGKAKDEAA